MGKKLFKFATYLRLKLAMDHRDYAAKYGPQYDKIDEAKKKIYVTLTYDDGEEEVEFPMCWEVCPTCDGNGKYVNPSIDSHGLTHEDFEDPDFKESYLSGGYDVQCAECKGRRVVPEIDEAALTPEQKAKYEEHLKHQQQEAKWRHEDEMTMRRERGGY